MDIKHAGYIKAHEDDDDDEQDKEKDDPDGAPELKIEGN
ncbi:hypothetical protein CCACVL1_25508 [Corchorus capsularis]|uniref:Uncharacterized protein n=1 Tax=Corchorus capsularis TaxID=210143 RepID=A0A1R3GJI6_COCAP|nr:hypothetical protein CCACVL1_25508 [Corchorus capsularis]